MITRGEFLTDTTEDELFAVVSSVIERMKIIREHKFKRIFNAHQDDLDALDIGTILIYFKLLATDEEMGKAVRKTIKDWKPKEWSK